MEGRLFPTCGYRLCAAHARLKQLQELHGWRAACFQNAALALAPRTLVQTNCKSVKDGRRFRLQNVALALVSRTRFESFRTRNGVSERLGIVRASQFR
eukprot:7335884-Pyramimonas_sp.AAC.2